MSTSADEGFAAFFAEAEPKLRRALVAAYGHERGRDAVAEALAYGWQHWERIERMDNPIGYLYRVGQSRTRPPRLRRHLTPAATTTDLPWIEPGLLAAFERLSNRERLSVVLIEGFGWTYREVASTTGLAPGSIQNYVSRGLAKLRTALGVDDA